ncbi:type II secretion system F family protein [Urechidicola croceus]|uniref:General secretion pathway protein GspF n=1 Tax=Urechidicola croceus TaxID=1850246 RepID=A0A1D8P880_9FLAO|nr:type II secretion system F family protein [Urechidicola croceus]AOW20783.1 general secretion pathway protein GspF [Urechidicola croceus]
MAFKLDSIPSKKEKKSFDLDSILKREITFLSKPFSNKKKEALYTELSVLLNAGISLKDALSLITQEFKNKKDKALFENIIESIIKGSSFSNAISTSKDFTEYEYHSLKIGEETGTLQKVTKELGLFFKRRNEQKRNIINALTYPIVVLSTALLAVVFMLKFVVPMFADIFKQNNVELPWITKVIMSFSNGFQKYFGVFILLIMLLLVFRKMISKKEWFQKFATRFLLKIPFVGELVRKMYIAQFTQATALLTGAKVPILNAVQLTSNMIPFYPLKKGLIAVEKQILLGKSLSASLKSQKIFDSKMVSLIKVADETNQNEFIFQRLTEQYNDEIQHKSKMLSTILEPLIIIILGTIVAVILIAMYLPMFKLSTVIG